MTEAVKAVEAGMSLRQAAKVYNVPVETTRRTVLGKVSVDCKPGPATVFSEEENELVTLITLYRWQTWDSGLPEGTCNSLHIV